MTRKTEKQNKEAKNEQVPLILIYSKDTGSCVLSHCLSSVTELVLHQLWVYLLTLNVYYWMRWRFIN